MTPSAGSVARAIVISLSMAGLPACRETVFPGPDVQNFMVMHGNGQSAERMDTLPLTLVARLFDDGGDPVQGAQVTWSASEDAGLVLPLDTTTSGEGLARAKVALGFAPVQHVEARADGFDDVARFTLTATSAAGLKAVSLMKNSGESHMCALDVEGRAWCWGDNEVGELGDGSIEPSDHPVLVRTEERFTRLYGASNATCGLAADGRMLCWGRNQYRFGNGSAQDSRLPVPAGSGLRFRTIDVGFDVGCGVTLDGDAYCWGSGALGNGLPDDESPVPTRIASGGNWREIATDDTQGCVTSRAGEVRCWGFGTRELGIPAPTADVPTTVSLVSDLSGISMSWWNQCGMQAGRGAVCWGEAYTAFPVLIVRTPCTRAPTAKP